MNPLDDNSFRHEYGRLTAILSRRFGVHNIEAVEDAVQSALMRAIEHWPVTGQPENPSAWLYRVAHNALMGDLRTSSGRRRKLDQTSGGQGLGAESELTAFLASEVQDDLLRMLFVCCNEAIPVESQLALALKTLCGFNTREISIRLFTSEANIYKRLGRARAQLRATAKTHREEESSEAHTPLTEGELSIEQYTLRLPALHKVLYLLFTEGYLSSQADQVIRKELCSEAIRLTEILVQHQVGQGPQSAALLALMHLHAARMGGRQDQSGGLLLLEEQDRSLWDQEQIAVGLAWLAKSAHGKSFSRYHAEAGVAAEHCRAKSFSATRWDRVAECYLLLEQSAPSALHRLNRAVAVAEWRGAAEGLALLDGAEPPTWLAGSYLWAAVLSDLQRRCGNTEKAIRYKDLALRSAPSEAVRSLLNRRLA